MSHRIDRAWITAGKAHFTVSNPAGDRYTYRVVHRPGTDRFAPKWFVGLLTGPDNTRHYTYLGILDAETGDVRLTDKSAYGNDARPVKVLRYALRHWVYGREEIPAGYAVHHEGRCCRCGRLLTVPESIESGIGPECATRMLPAF